MKSIIFLLVLSVVLPVTLALWIPLLVRMVCSIAFAAVASVFTKGDLGGIHQALDEAIRLPILVIRRTVAAVFGDNDQSHSQFPAEVSWGRLIGESVFALVFWTTTLVLVFGVDLWESGKEGNPPKGAGAATVAAPPQVSMFIFTSDASLMLEVRRRRLFGAEENGTFMVTPDRLTFDLMGASSVLEVTLCQISQPTLVVNQFYAW